MQLRGGFLLGRTSSEEEANHSLLASIGTVGTLWSGMGALMNKSSVSLLTTDLSVETFSGKKLLYDAADQSGTELFNHHQAPLLLTLDPKTLLPDQTTMWGLKENNFFCIYFFSLLKISIHCSLIVCSFLVILLLVNCSFQIWLQ